MQKQLFEKEPKAKRVQLLEGIADGIEQQTYMRELAPEELSFHKDRFSQLSIEVSKINDDLKKYKDSIKDRVKPMQADLHISLQNIKLKAEEVTARVFRVVDQDEKMTGFYDETGKLINQRPMTEDEKQLTIASSKRTGTHD